MEHIREFIIALFFVILVMILFMMINKKVEKFENVDIQTNVDNLKKKVDSIQVDLQAIQGIASIYNTGKMTLTDLDVTGRLTVGGDTTIGGEFHGLKSVKSDNGLIGMWSLVSGDSNIGGKITVTGGGDFSAPAGSGKKYYFSDDEQCGKIRVGCFGGKSTIYAENGSLQLGGSNGSVDIRTDGIQQNLHDYGTFIAEGNTTINGELTGTKSILSNNGLVGAWAKIDNKGLKAIRPFGWQDDIWGVTTMA